MKFDRTLKTLCVVSAFVTSQESIAQLEEVLVTAQKREQSMQDVGIAVTALTGDTMRTLGINESNEVAAQIPNMIINNQGGPDGLPLFFIRGVGLTDFSNANSGPVAIYVNDVYIKAPRAQNFSIFDVERLEVLRGPQGTLFGRNTTGGAVLFSTRKPTDELEANARVDIGNYGTYTAEGGLGGPITDNLSGRIAGRYTTSDGYIDNLTTGDTQPESDRWSARGTLVYTPTDTLDITTYIEGGDKDGLSNANKFRGLLDPGSGELCSPKQTYNFQCTDAFGQTSATDDLHDMENNLVEDQTEEYLSITMRVNWELNDSMSFASITNYLDLEAYQPDDTDGSPMQLVELFLDEESDQFSQEFQLLGSGEKSNWVIGAYYLTDNAKASHDYALLQEFAPIFESIPVDTPVDAAQEALGGLYGLAGSTGVFRETYDQDGETWAIFGQYEYDLTEQFHLTIGLRYTEEETDIVLDTIFNANLFPVDENGDGMDDYFVRGGVPVVAQDETVSDENLSGKLGLDYRPTDDLLIYASYSTAFKAPGFNTSAIFSSDEAQPFKSEEITSYELGFKADLVDGTLRVNGAVFYYDYEDMQVFTSRITESGVPARFIDNAAEGEYRGAELEITALPMDGLYLQLGMGYIDAELNEFFTEDRDPETGELVIEDFSGAIPANTPDWTFNALARYEWNIFDGVGAVQADYSWQDDVFHTTDNSPYRATEAYGQLGARISWLSEQSGLEIVLWGRNLTDEDERSYSSDLSFVGLMNDTVLPPRTYGVSLSYDL